MVVIPTLVNEMEALEEVLLPDADVVKLEAVVDVEVEAAAEVDGMKVGCVTDIFKWVFFVLDDGAPRHGNSDRVEQRYEGWLILNDCLSVA